MLLSALIFGLLGSFHCIGMCGPIAFMLPVDREKPIKRFLQILSYHLGRIFTNAIIGILFGLLG
ncbi:urease accessory protein UreH domain-containing protein, partial [Polaribacter sp.]|uniref:urease accessory protein UreH domain-containing protein n=1 Tax=Polaribacter sp. TaxID=1920175 RepID=UPI003F69DDAD